MAIWSPRRLVAALWMGTRTREGTRPWPNRVTVEAVAVSHVEGGGGSWAHPSGSGSLGEGRGRGNVWKEQKGGRGVTSSS